jgi:hypothetical protein
MTGISKEVSEVKQLAEKLQQYECVSKFDCLSESEAWRLAYSIFEMKESFRNLLDIHLPALHDVDSEEAAQDALLDVGEELRHILYHMKDSKFFAYLFED